MTARAALAAEWRQFMVLSRGRVRAMLDAALFSRDADPMLFALWVGAMVSAVPLLFAMRKTLAYAALRGAPAETVELVLFGDRLFFVVYSMLTAAFVTALTWEALFPADEDIDVLGVLPVHPPTVAAAHLGAAVVGALAFCAATILPSAFLFSLVAGTESGILVVPRSFFAHMASCTGAAAAMVLALLSLRGIVAVAAGARVALRLGLLLQVITVVSMAAVLFFLPGVLQRLAPAMLFDRAMPGAALRALWFAGLFATLAGTQRAFLAVRALTGVGVLAASCVAVVIIYLAPAGLVRRRAAGLRERARADRLTAIARLLACAMLRSRVSRAMFVFATASLSRSRRHAVVLATYVALPVAFILITLLVTVVRRGAFPAGPAVSIVALPAIATFLIVVGLRTVFAIPTEIAANWPFRLADPGIARATSATRACLWLFGIAPPLLLTAALAPFTGWPGPVIVRLVVCQAATGVLRVECVLRDWRKAPFVCAHAADPETCGRDGWSGWWRSCCSPTECSAAGACHPNGTRRNSARDRRGMRRRSDRSASSPDRPRHRAAVRHRDNWRADAGPLRGDGMR
jgi:hypothetical protein